MSKENPVSPSRGRTAADRIAMWRIYRGGAGLHKAKPFWTGYELISPNLNTERNYGPPHPAGMVWAGFRVARTRR